MASRSERARIAEETVAILEAGCYEHPAVGMVDIADELARAVEGTVTYDPAAVAHLLQSRLQSPATVAAPGDSPAAMSIEVRNCTTFAAARQLGDGRPAGQPLCLNFASAKNPGGGFLGGSQAQEEALARASGLYACIRSQTAYYARNRAHRSSLYTDHLIYSPGVPVFRDDDDRLLLQPFTTAIVTAPAPNAGAVRANSPDEVGDIVPTMRRRIQAVLGVAREHHHADLVLGAWGCGVFRNDPDVVAGLFRDVLDEPPFRNAFERVVFAVLDHSAGRSTIRPFEQAFAGP